MFRPANSALAALLAATGFFAFPAQAAEFACAKTVLEDPAGDWDNAFTAGAGAPHQDIHSITVGESSGEAGDLVHFELKVDSMPAVLPPNATWFISFETPNGFKRGVRLATDDLGEASYFAYVVSPGGIDGDGPSDGRFVEAGSEFEATIGEYAADGTIHIAVPIFVLQMGGDTLGPFNAGTVQGGNLVAVSFALVVDEAPAGLGRAGFYDLCSADDKSAFLGVGALPAGTLAWLALGILAGLGRRRAA